jgi:hypothetical protein
VDQIDPLLRELADVEGTLRAHGDDGDGWCTGEHEPPEHYPCQSRLWMEHALEKTRRRHP